LSAARRAFLLQSENRFATVKTPSGDQIQCPLCGSADLRWSNQPHLLNYVMAFVFRDPIRCCGCGYRFYRRALSDLEYAAKIGQPSAGEDEAGGRKRA
jgi:C4-type Zn-finger protein